MIPCARTPVSRIYSAALDLIKKPSLPDLQSVSRSILVVELNGRIMEVLNKNDGGNFPNLT